MSIELSADQLGQLSAVLRLAGSRTVPSERRRTQRLDVRASVSIAMVNDGESGPPIAMRIRDLSPRGVALLHTEPMQPGQQFILTLQRGDGPPVEILCTVVHSLAGKGRLHTIGAEFTCAISNLSVPREPSAAELQQIRSSILD
jgi:hypothetical protein